MRKEEFINGFICALVTINDLYNIPTMCVNAIKSCGFDKKDFNKISGYDKKGLKKILKEALNEDK